MTITTSIFIVLYILLNWNPRPIKQRLPTHPSPALATLILFSASRILTTLTLYYGMDSHRICLFVTALFHSAYRPQGLFMLLHMTEFSSFSRLIFCCRDIPHLACPFIHTDRHLGCHNLAITNNATLNMGVQIPL